MSAPEGLANGCEPALSTCVGLKWDNRRLRGGLGGGLGVPCIANRHHGGPNALGRRNRAVRDATVGVDISPPSDSGWSEPYPEGDG